jgi:hypothetical protein
MGAGAARAQARVQLGPPDGAPDVRSVVFDPVMPGVAYAGLAGGGVARSSDGGSTWRAATLSHELSTVISLLVAPSRHLFALAPGGLYESGDGARQATFLKGRVPPLGASTASCALSHLLAAP